MNIFTDELGGVLNSPNKGLIRHLADERAIQTTRIYIEKLHYLLIAIVYRANS